MYLNESSGQGEGLLLRAEEREHITRPGLSLLEVTLASFLLLGVLLSPSMGRESLVFFWFVFFVLLVRCWVAVRETRYWLRLEVSAAGAGVLELLMPRGEVVTRSFSSDELLNFTLVSHRPLPSEEAPAAARYGDLTLTLTFRDQRSFIGELVLRGVADQRTLRAAAERIASATGLTQLTLTGDHDGNVLISGLRAPATAASVHPDDEGVRASARDGAPRALPSWGEGPLEQRGWHPSLDYLNGEVSFYLPEEAIHFSQVHSPSSEGALALSVFSFMFGLFTILGPFKAPSIVPILFGGGVVLGAVALSVLRARRRLERRCMLSLTEGTLMIEEPAQGRARRVELAEANALKLSFTFFAVAASNLGRSRRRYRIVGYHVDGHLELLGLDESPLLLASTGLLNAGDPAAYQSLLKLAERLAEQLQLPLKIVYDAPTKELQSFIEESLAAERVALPEGFPEALDLGELSIVSENPHLISEGTHTLHQQLGIGSGSVGLNRSESLRALLFAALALATFALLAHA